GLVGHVAVHREHSVAHLGGGVLLRPADVCGDDARAFTDEHLRRRLRHPRASPGDDRHLAVQQPHRPSPLTRRRYCCHSRDPNSCQAVCGDAGGNVPDSKGSDPYYDPYDVGIYADPYPVLRRLREEAPLYRNDEYDFFALSRFADVERGLADRATYISGRGGILELIKANIPMPRASSSSRTPRSTRSTGRCCRASSPRRR